MVQLSEKLRSELLAALQKLTFPDHPSELYDPMRYTLALGGKRIRPLLALLGARLSDEAGEDSMRVALAVELFHNFTLIHDDIMDEAPLRRGQPSVHQRWNRDVAILSGDAMLIKAYEQLALCRPAILPQLLRIFNRTAIEVCEGQQMDMDFETRQEVTVPEYLKMIELKTAVLLGASLQMGALSAGLDLEGAGRLYEFGRHVGIAFQLKDDWLDVYADPEKFGKMVGGDIVAGKKTYLYLRACELGNEEQRKALSEWMTSAGLPEAEKVKKVKGLFDELGLSDRIYGEMNGFFQKGLSFLDQVNVEEERKSTLRTLAAYLMTREE